jgi:hypothetical protein
MSASRTFHRIMSTKFTTRQILAGLGRACLIAPATFHATSGLRGYNMYQGAQCGAAGAVGGLYLVQSLSQPLGPWQ